MNMNRKHRYEQREASRFWKLPSNINVTMVKCAVPCCKNDSRKQNKKNNNISYHRFPKNLEMAQKWAKAINRPNWEPNIASSVCSIHFNSASICETKQGLNRLVQCAIPELYLQDGANKVVKSLPSSRKPVVADTKDCVRGVKYIPNNILIVKVKEELVDPLEMGPSASELMVQDVQDHIPDYKDTSSNLRLNGQINYTVKKEVPLNYTVKKEVPSSSKTKSKAKDFTPNSTDTQREIKLKRHIIHLHGIAKRRRSRCNALYTQNKRLKNKIKSLTEMVAELRAGGTTKEEHN